MSLGKAFELIAYQVRASKNVTYILNIIAEHAWATRHPFDESRKSYSDIPKWLTLQVEEEKHPLAFIPGTTVTSRGPPPHDGGLLQRQLTRMRHEQLKAYVLAWLGVSHDIAERTSTDEIAGFSTPDAYRLHCVMLYIS
jgi:hypothetical protein